MKLVNVTKDCQVIPTSFGIFINVLCQPLFWLSRRNHYLFKVIYRFFLTGNWWRLVTFVNIQSKLTKNRKTN